MTVFFEFSLNELILNLTKKENNNDSYELCYSYELKNDFENLFSLRFSNHFNIYQNVNVKKWEKSFEDVFDKSDEINKYIFSARKVTLESQKFIYLSVCMCNQNQYRLIVPILSALMVFFS